MSRGTFFETGGRPAIIDPKTAFEYILKYKTQKAARIAYNKDFGVDFKYDHVFGRSAKMWIIYNPVEARKIFIEESKIGAQYTDDLYWYMKLVNYAFNVYSQGSPIAIITWIMRKENEDLRTNYSYLFEKRFNSKYAKDYYTIQEALCDLSIISQKGLRTRNFAQEFD